MTYSDKEQQFLIIYMGILLIHEIAHLVLRWNGILNSPSEAGDFLEIKLFSGIVRLLVQPNTEWTKESECIGIGVERCFSTEGLKIYILAYRDYLKKIYLGTLAEDCYEAPKFLEKKIDKDTLALKQMDEQIENSSDWRKDIEEIIGPFMLLEDIGSAQSLLIIA
ncbi:hypothetical protein BpHYR1_039923 [Brachionus plicatilis]|uniref:Uncharacterized protein n=1 Tax=Brachionus plicatilis TaxID=10195 RepID=A0A3M7QC00_BRAPC|nr:hypothetical protein BpHYR1_039923 [Brachionus plicatilis]